MSESEQRPWSDANRIAQQLVGEWQPLCDRIAVAGSIRRRKPQVADLDLVIIPSYGITQLAIGGGGIRENLLHRHLSAPEQRGRIEPVSPGGGRGPDRNWAKKSGRDSRKWSLWLPRPGLEVDVWLTTPDQWGLTYLVRTGGRRFNIGVVAALKERGYRMCEGWVVEEGTGETVATPSEASVFHRAGLDYIEPTRRTGEDAAQWVSRHARRRHGQFAYRNGHGAVV